MDKKSIQSSLQEKFAVEDVKQREGGFGKKLDYIPIDGVINRLNDVLPLGYSWIVNNTVILEGSVIVTGTLEIILSDAGGTEVIRRSGVGADAVGKDMDKAVKTAYAEAFKKACNTLGVGLYLWDEEERNELARERQNGIVDSKRTFSPQQLEKMKHIRTSLKLTTDDEVNKFLKEKYQNAKVNKKADLTPTNIDEFFDFAMSVVASKNPNKVK